MNKPPNQYDIIRKLRLPLIALVTYAHSYGGMTEGYSVLGSGWDTYEVLKLLVSQTLVKVAMPTFFAISGYLFFANVETLSREVYWQKIRRRVNTLLIPYLVWNLLMAIKLNTYSLSVFWTPANMPLWFLRDLMVVSLLTPIIYIGVKRLGGWLLVALLPVYLTGIWAIQPGLNPYALCFFTIGAFLSIKKKDIIDTCMKIEKPAYILSTMLVIAMLLTYGMSVFPLLMLCLRVVGIAAVFCLANRGTRFAQRGLSPLCEDAAYFIYLSHYVLFFGFIDSTFFALFGTSTTSLSIHYLLCPLLKVAVLIAIYSVWRRLASISLR